MMFKLLKAGFFRLKKENIFWLFFCISVSFAIINIFRYYNSESPVILDNIANQFILYIGFLMAIFISTFVGKEYSEGIIRNKIIVGHSRMSIYLSKLIVTILASVLCESIYIIIVLLVGTPLLGNLQMSVSQFAICILNTFLVITVYASILNFIALICSEITVSTIISILLCIIFFGLESYFGYIANSPKYTTHSYWEDGVEYIISKEPNPNYPGDDRVKLAKTIYFFIPQGQASTICSINMDNLLYKVPISSLTLIIIFNIIGLYLFSKKELK